ncbi:beta-N-acetylhexosaminidase [Catenulispora yoronensis]|uniref:beta-N-acetylhexosaminidase n=1 Tax=Catenulispora yoronensis TaxID=450799 RepID=UPI0031D6E413
MILDSSHVDYPRGVTGRSSALRNAVFAGVCAAALTSAACGGSGGAASSSPPPASSSASGAAGTAPDPPAAPGSAADLAALQRVVPQPTTITANAGVFAFGATTAIHASAGAEPIAADLAAYLKQQTGLAVSANGGADAPVQLVLQPTGGDPEWGTEGYKLVVRSTSVKITAADAAGLFHGVQTLRQLVAGDNKVQAGVISDHPRFGYRGVMLDVARHFYSVADVKSYIDAAALYKINEFHLHLTDDQGWRLTVPDYPKLTSVGGASQVGGGAGGSYSAADLKAIVDYAASRYMTVIPEVDMPGHVGAAVHSYPELACDGRKHGAVTTVSPAYDSLCTKSESTYGFVDSVMKAAAEASPGPLLHMGGDEAQALNLTQYNGFVKRAQDAVAGTGRTPVAWAEAATAPLLPQTILEYWDTAHPLPAVAQAATRGTKLIMAPGDHAYLDQQYTPGFPLGLHWAGYTSVSKAYDWDPVTVLPGVPPTAVVGVEAPLWSETVKSLADAETLAFPRLPAVAEIGWSAPVTHDFKQFAGRLGKQAGLWGRVGIRFYRSPEVPWS